MDWKIGIAIYQLNKSLNDKSRDEKIFVLNTKLNYIGKTILKVLDDFCVSSVAISVLILLHK